MSAPADAKPACFVLMPISDPDGYDKGHFKRVFDDIFSPACEKAGFEAIRADQVRATNLIHLDMLQKILESPMALCDLSTRNPNVMFELGLRQAFNRPVVLVREVGTPDIFDIAGLRYCEYRKSHIYNEVIEDQENIAKVIMETQDAFEKGQGVNSIVKLLSITQPASLIDIKEAENNPILQLIRAELSEMRSEFKAALRVRPLGFSSVETLSLHLKQLLDQTLELENKLKVFEYTHPDNRETLIELKEKYLRIMDNFSAIKREIVLISSPGINQNLSQAREILIAISKKLDLLEIESHFSKTDDDEGAMRPPPG